MSGFLKAISVLLVAVLVGFCSIFIYEFYDFVLQNQIAVFYSWLISIGTIGSVVRTIKVV